MSRVYWHTPTATAALAGAERGWCRHLTERAAKSTWGFSEPGGRGLERALWLLEHAIDGQAWGVADLKLQARTIRDRLATTPTSSHGWQSQDLERELALLRWMDPVMSLEGIDFRVHGVLLNTASIDHNTALYAGSNPVALASKIHGWCENHAWIEGSDRDGVAKIIEEGLALRLYRTGMGWESRYSEYDEGNGVLDLLRANASEPVVLSYSVCDSFPNPNCTTWEFHETQVYTSSGEEDEESSAEDWASERWADAWSELSSKEKWDTGMAWLRRERSWARINPADLRDYTFGAPVSVYDFLGDDIDTHLAEQLKDRPGFVAPEKKD